MWKPDHNLHPVVSTENVNLIFQSNQHPDAAPFSQVAIPLGVLLYFMPLLVYKNQEARLQLRILFQHHRQTSVVLAREGNCSLGCILHEKPKICKRVWPAVSWHVPSEENATFLFSPNILLLPPPLTFQCHFFALKPEDFASMKDGKGRAN